MTKVILSLFDGISCGQVAINRLGIRDYKYYASEIEASAIKITQHNFPNTIQIGDVTQVKGEDLPKIDLLMGGSPCQNFSFAGKRNGMSTKDNVEITTLEQYLEFKKQDFKFDGQSYLFWEYVRILKEVKPKYFLLENVKMINKWKDLISSILGVEPILINSSLVSAQNRERLYWTNIPLGNLNIKDRGLYIKDIIFDNSYKTYSDERIEKTKRRFFSERTKTKGIKFDLSGKGYFSQQDRCFDLDSKSPCLPKSRMESKVNIIINEEQGLYRRIHPIEAERLQTLPDNYTNVVSNTKRFEGIGNGWTVDVIVEILKQIEEF